MTSPEYAHEAPNRQRPSIGALMAPAATLKLFARNGSNGALEALIVAHAAEWVKHWRAQWNRPGIVAIEPTEHSSIEIARDLKAHHRHVEKALANLAGMGFATCRVLGLGLGLSVEFDWDAILGELAR